MLRNRLRFVEGRGGVEEPRREIADPAMLTGRLS
jgi:hypothetical protein